MRTLLVSLFILNSILTYSQTPEYRKKQKIDEDQILDVFNQILDPTFAKDREFPFWANDLEYYTGDVIRHEGKAYESIFDYNKTIPSDTAKKWKSISAKAVTIEGITITTWINTPEFEKKLARKYKHLLDSNGRMPVEALVTFSNCNFYRFTFRNLRFHNGLVFNNCKSQDLHLDNIKTTELRIEVNELGDIGISNSKIDFVYISDLKEPKDFDGIQTLYFFNSTINYARINYLPKSISVRIQQCNFPGNKSGSFWENNAFYFSGTENNTLTKFTIFKSVFGSSSDSTVTHFAGNFSSIEIDSSVFFSHVFLDVNAQEKVHINNNSFNSTFAINNAILPTDVKIRWSQLTGRKLAKFKSTPVYDASTDTYRQVEYLKPSKKDGITIIDHYEDIMRSYQMLYSYYKNSGDIESANGCFSEMKDVQTDRYAYLFTQEKTFKSFFRWKLAQLMKFYTGHGTDPARAIVVSMWVMIAFAVFYFFFPSDWDVTSKSKLISNYKDFIEKNEKGYIKPFFMLALGFSVSMMNAFTLSVNSFTTLGFGNIPTHGIAKYFCVLEGFIGWFLLSIFTVALINQVLG